MFSMANIDELRYINGDFNALDVDDIIVIFKGNMYVLNENDGYTDELLGLLKELCTTFPSLKEEFYTEDGELRNVFCHSAGDLLDALYDEFNNFPKVVIGLVGYDDNDGLSLAIDNYSYNVTSSPEFKQFLNSEQGKKFDKVIVNGRTVAANDTAKSPHQIQFANPLYHGTVMQFLTGILTKGLRKIQDNSIFTVNNEGFVFMTSEFKVAKEYAEAYSRSKKSPKAIIQINSDYIDHDKVVLDYDFVKEFTFPGKEDPYTDSRELWKAFKGEVAQNAKRYGTKFVKIGYKGIVMPKAIEGVYLFDKNGMEPTFHTKEEVLKMFSQNESIGRLDEFYAPNDFHEMTEVIRLYHGTDIYALEDILTEGEINASHGNQNGETKGLNWFFTAMKNNFAKGVLFSIEVGKDEFEDGSFKFMNDGCVVSRDARIPLAGRNFRIENLGGFGQEEFNRLLEKCNGDVYEFKEELAKVNGEFQKVDEPYIDSPVILQILKQTVGDNVLRKEGIIESVQKVNEVAASEISLDSFEPQDTLNPKIWVNDKINSQVRLRLLDIADDFLEECSTRWVKPDDIVLTGSLANYNWSRYSDLDVHILMDFGKVYKKKELVEDYFDSKKELWKRDHQDLKIYGFPVEIYVQDTDAKFEASGVYSLNRNEWIREPQDLDDVKINGEYVKREAAKYMTMIDGYEKDLKRLDDTHKIEKIGEKVKKLFDKLKNIRKESLRRNGEMSSGNIIYKIIRRMGYLDKVWEIINTTYNKSKALK